MEFRSIFTDEAYGKLVAVCYPEDNMVGEEQTDIFEKLLDQWNDDEFLVDFFTKNSDKLARPFWEGMSIDEAIQQVKDEVDEFENELWSIETKQPGYENYSLNAIFKPLHTNIYSLNFKNESHRKAKPYVRKPMLRVYAIELEDGTFVITGGAIKLTEKMEGEEFKLPFKQLEQVQEFLGKYLIENKVDLLEQK